MSPRPSPGRRGCPLPAHPGAAGRADARCRILWTVWACVVLINLTVWTLVSLGNGEPDYFWPMWLLVPGAALFGATAITAAVRSRR